MTYPLVRLALRPLVLVALALAVAGGCAAKTGTSESPLVKCTPGAYVFCRCQDRQEGTKLCGDDGHSFGRCEPCETDTNPVVPDDPDHPPVMVDGGADAAQDSGPPPTCGDAIVEDGEDCDDGNHVEDDGCDATCKLAGTDPFATRSCPGLATHVWSKPVVYSGTTVGSTFRGNLSPTCNSTGSNPTSGASGPDRVFDVVAHRTGTMTASTTDVDYDCLLYVTQACVQSPAPITYLKCAHDVVGVGGETLSFPVTAGQHYSVVVDGAGIAEYQGQFKLTLAIH